MRISRKLVAGFAVIVLVGGGCVAKRSQPAPTSTVPQEQKEATLPPEKGQMAVLPEITVGVMAPLSGTAAGEGQSVRRAVQLAQKELGLEKVKFIFEDSKCEKNAATAAVTKLITVDKVSAVIGGVCGDETLAAAQVAQPNQVVMISPAAAVRTLSDTGDFIFRTIPSDASQAAFGANLVYQKGFRRLAVLYTEGEDRATFTEMLKEEFTRLDGEVVATETVNPNTAGVETQMIKMKEAGPDALFVVSNSVKNIVAAMQEKRDLNWNIPVFGSTGVKNDQVLAGAKGAAEDMIVTTIGTGSQPFVELHKKEFGSEPGPFAAQTYDAVQILAVAFRDGARTGEEIRDAFYNISLTGVSGQIEFDQKGDIPGNYDVFVVKNAKFEKE